MSAHIFSHLTKDYIELDGMDGTVITLNERRISSVNDLFAGRFQPDSLERKGVRRSYSTLRENSCTFRR